MTELIPDNLLDFAIVDRNGNKWRTSKVFLYKSSSYFRAIFNSMAFIESNGDCATLAFDGSQIELVLRFIDPYNGALSEALGALDKADLGALLEIVDYLGCDEIIRHIENIIHKFPLDEDIHAMWKDYGLSIDKKDLIKMLSTAAEAGIGINFLTDEDIVAIYDDPVAKNLGQAEISRIDPLRRYLKRYAPKLTNRCLINLINATMEKWGINTKNKKIVVYETCTKCYIASQDLKNGLCFNCRAQ